MRESISIYICAEIVRCTSYCYNIIESIYTHLCVEILSLISFDVDRDICYLMIEIVTSTHCYYLTCRCFCDDVKW